jgi:hypothetical protein
MKKLLLLLLLPVCVLGQEEQADTLDLDYYLLSNENGWCSLQANGNPAYITKIKQIKDCLGSVDTSQYDYFIFYFNSTPISDFEAFIITHRDSSVEILLSNVSSMFMKNVWYQFIGLLPKGLAQNKCKLTYRFRRSNRFSNTDTSLTYNKSPYEYKYLSLEPITK